MGKVRETINQPSGLCKIWIFSSWIFNFFLYTAIGRFKSRSLQNFLLNIFGVLFFSFDGKGPGNN